MSTDLLETLLASGHLTTTNVQLLRRYMTKWHTSAFNSILETHLMSEQVLADTLAELMKIDRIYTLSETDLTSNAFEKITYRQAIAWEVLPLGKDPEKSHHFRALIADPTCKETAKKIQATLGEEVKFSICERRYVVKYIDDYYPVEKQVPSLLSPRTNPP